MFFIDNANVLGNTIDTQATPNPKEDLTMDEYRDNVIAFFPENDLDAEDSTIYDIIMSIGSEDRLLVNCALTDMAKEISEIYQIGKDIENIGKPEDVNAMINKVRDFSATLEVMVTEMMGIYESDAL